MLRTLRRMPLRYGMYAIFALVACALLVISTNSQVASLLASSASSLNGKPAVIFLAPHDEGTLFVGGTAKLDVRVNTRLPINAAGITVHFPKDTVEILGVSKESSVLDLWTEDTKISEEIGEIHFSGGSIARGGLLGINTLLTITVRAKQNGTAEFYFTDTNLLAHDGRGRELEHDTRTHTFIIEDAAELGGGVSAPPTASNPDLNSDGAISLADMSILAIQLFAPYNARYDLNKDGVVNLGDISDLFSEMH